MQVSPIAPDGGSIVVLGMHRSGTSLLCTLLAHSGVFFGDEGQLIPPNEENPKGFWEHLGVRSINDRLLHASLSDWDYVSNFDYGSIPLDTISQLRSEAGDLLADLNRQSLTGIKEPRVCLLYEFWRPLLSHGIHIFVSRHPAEIARSLNVRNGTPLEVGLALCEFYLVNALNSLGESRCLFLDHQDLLRDPLQSLQRVEQHLQESNPSLALKIDIEKVSALVDMSYYRAKRQGSESNTLPDALQKLWDVMHSGAQQVAHRAVSAESMAILNGHDKLVSFNAHLASKQLVVANAALEKGLQEVSSLYQSNKETIDGLHALRNEQKAKADQLTAAIDELRSIRLEQHAKIEQLNLTIEELHVIRLEQKARITELNSKVGELHDLRQEQQAKVEQLKQTVDERHGLYLEQKDKATQLNAKVDELHTIRLEQKDKIAELNTKIGELHNLRQEQQAKIEQLKQTVDERHSLYFGQKEKAAQLKCKVDELHGIRLEQKEKIDLLNNKVGELHRLRLEQQARIEQLTAKVAELATLK